MLEPQHAQITNQVLGQQWRDEIGRHPWYARTCWSI